MLDQEQRKRVFCQTVSSLLVCSSHTQTTDRSITRLNHEEITSRRSAARRRPAPISTSVPIAYIGRLRAFRRVGLQSARVSACVTYRACMCMSTLANIRARKPTDRRRAAPRRLDGGASSLAAGRTDHHPRSSNVSAQLTAGSYQYPEAP